MISTQSKKIAKAIRMSSQVSTQSCPDIMCTVVTGEVTDPRSQKCDHVVDGEGDQQQRKAKHEHDANLSSHSSLA